MSEKIDLDQVRSAVLDRVERSERNFKLVLYAAAAWEMLFVAAFVLGMERHNRLHVLLLLSTVGSYTLVVLGLVALGAYVNRGILRVLRAIELLKDQLGGGRR